MGRITRREWAWALAVSALVVIVSTLPYLAGYMSQTSAWRFCGAVLDLEDYYSHLAKMWQGYRGAWLYRLLFTPEEHDGAYLQTFYVALGHLARVTGLCIPLTYHLTRVVTGVGLLLVAYRFIALFAMGATRRVAFLLATSSSGLGWLVQAVRPTPPGGISPIDFWLMDGNTFFSLFTFPHFSVAIALLLALYTLILRLTETNNRTAGWPKMALAVLFSWGLGIVHPYALLLADLVPALYLAWSAIRQRQLPVLALLTLLLMAVTQLPLLLYDYHIFSAVPVFQAWAAQNITLSPPPIYYLLGYGLVAALAIWGLHSALRASGNTVFLLVWALVAFILAYLPWGLQRRFVEGVHVGLCVLAGYGLTESLLPALARPLRRLARFLHYEPRRLRWLVQALVIVVAALSNLYLVSTYTLAAATRHPSLFHAADEVSAVEWLSIQSEWDATVLASYETGGEVVGLIGHRVVLGHWAETIHLSQKQAEAQAFYATEESFDRAAFLARYGIVFVFHGPRERAMGGFDPAAVPYLEPVFRQGDVTLYRVESEP